MQKRTSGRTCTPHGLARDAEIPVWIQTYSQARLYILASTECPEIRWLFVTKSTLRADRIHEYAVSFDPDFFRILCIDP